MGDRPSLRVLLVDPSAAQLRALTARLEAQDMAVLAFPDPMEALEALPGFRPQVLLTELVLPVISGLDLLRLARTWDPDLRTLVLTAASGEWASAAAFSAGASFVLLKPADPEQVCRLVRELAAEPADRIQRLLLACGAPHLRSGLRQCARCAALLSRSPAALLKELYIQAARAEGTSPANVSKNVERFVKAFWDQGDPARLGLPAGDGPPGIREFLSALVQAATFPL